MEKNNCLMDNKEVAHLTEGQREAVAAALDALDAAVFETLPAWLMLELRQARGKMIKAFGPETPRR